MNEELAAAAMAWENAYHRARAGASSAGKGCERMGRRVERLKQEVTLLKGQIERLTHENNEQQKKISRLSLELLSCLSDR